MALDAIGVATRLPVNAVHPARAALTPPDLAGGGGAIDVLDRETIRRLYRTRLSRGRATIGELMGGHIEVASEGAWVTTADGTRLLNCGGYGVFLMGARHPTVVRAVSQQLHSHPIATRMFLEPQLALAAESLINVSPPGLERVHFAGSGAEAVECAIKMARTHGHTRLISAVSGYHGKTLGALSLTAREVFQKPFRPLLPGATHVPYGDPAALEEVLALEPGNACVVLEPVQGEAGVIVPPDGYLRKVGVLCHRYGAFFVLDEVQTGLGRLGDWWGADRESVTPDVLLAGKGLSGGVVPVAAAIASAEAYAVFDSDPYLHTSTFSGAPIAMAAVRGAIQAIAEDDLVTRSRVLGAQILAQVRAIVTAHFGSLVAEVRGRGLLIGIEFTDSGPAGDLLIELVNQGVVANHSLNSDLVLRLTPPAVLTPSDLEYLFTAMDRACRAQAVRYVNV
jgi:putrescine aminotransferase